MTFGVGSHPTDVTRIGYDIYIPASIIWHRISPEGRILGAGSQIGMRDLVEFENTMAHGFFTLDLIRQDPKIDVARTLHRFINQLTGYIDHPETFEAAVSPSIQPTLITMR